MSWIQKPCTLSKVNDANYVYFCQCLLVLHGNVFFWKWIWNTAGPLSFLSKQGGHRLLVFWGSLKSPCVAYWLEIVTWWREWSLKTLSLYHLLYQIFHMEWLGFKLQLPWWEARIFWLFQAIHTVTNDTVCRQISRSKSQNLLIIFSIPWSRNKYEAIQKATLPCAECFTAPLWFLTSVMSGQNTKYLQFVLWRCINDAIHCQLNLAILLCDVIPDGKTE